MGVPALFRWLSKKYPKIVSRVQEETPTKVRDDTGELVEVPVQYAGRNPNGFEVDNLYLDMNGIVHPCTHPEGKPAPETEEEMMVEVFKYTERVVNMARPRKVLMMAIDGVAPRAKMNQQRSRRFRAAQEAAEKEEERREAIKMFEAMGHPVSEATKNQKGWDSNAITPGTPFMDLLSASLKYWVSYKLSTDPGWKDLKVIISDATVPGEGEHKIVDWIRRQRTYPEWDPNTTHAMYGLDADLIMLSLATHEPHFRVLREDVFFQGSKDPQVCKNCGQPGHFAANCKGEKKVKDPNVVEVAKPVDPKPFIWLDVACLREYLTVELNVPGVPFFDVELAIDDWIFMIFFVGNDFLPHLPSLEIREGAIDMLLKIWRAELPRMGGYLTNHGKVNLERAGIILEGLAKNEDEIFQKRKEDEERQNATAKRRRIEDHRRQDDAKARETALKDPDYVAVAPVATARGGALHPSLPQRPGFDTVPKAEAAGRPKKLTTAQQAESLKAGLQAMDSAGASNQDVVRNRKAIRMANMSAAQALKAELEGAPVEGNEEEGAGVVPAPAGDAAVETVVLQTEDEAQMQVVPEQARAILEEQGEDEGVDEDVVPPALRADEAAREAAVSRPGDESDALAVDGDGEGDDATTLEDESAPAPAKKRRTRKRKAGDDGDDDDDDEAEPADDDDAPTNPEDQPVAKKKLQVNPDGTVEYQDDIRLWEPGYRERYYRQKFGVELGDREFIDQITRSYMEGLCWVLEYYYQGVPAWDWYYPYHYAPFAQDFRNVGSLKIEFRAGEPFKPFAQLLGVFPAASRVHLPAPLQTLMIDDESPILDFYPSDFDIDMNGKKMAWQGVALLPFIDQDRLLGALKSKEDALTDDEKRRNRWGDNVMFISESNGLYDGFCELYTLKGATKPVPIDVKASRGTFGSVLSDPLCVPNSALETPLPSIPDCPDLPNNASLSVRYYFPRQAHKHRSVLLPGFRPPPAILSESDKDWTRRGGGGGGGRGRGGRQSYGNGNGGPGRSQPGSGYNTPTKPYGSAYGSGASGGYGSSAGGYGGGGAGSHGAQAYGSAAGSYGGAGRAANPYAAPTAYGVYNGRQPPPAPAYGYRGGQGSYGAGSYGGAGAYDGGGGYGGGAASYGGAAGYGLPSYGASSYGAAPAYGSGSYGYGGAGAGAGAGADLGAHRGAPPAPYGAPGAGAGGAGSYGGAGRGGYANPYAGQGRR
ncbi:5'-3' exoribonuclease 2 [Cryptotrichosporon argae]